MKKISKILALALTLVALCAALVIIGAANDTPASDKAWVVDGVAGEDELGGFDTLANAIAAAGGKKITLNKDVELADLVVTGTVKIDLGGHTVKTTKGTTFILKAGADFTLQGEGAFENVTTLFYVEGQGAKLSLNGYGNGINVKQVSTTNPVFSLLAGTETEMSGSFTFSPASLGTSRVFNVGLNGASLDKAAKLTLDAARVTVTEPYNGSHNSTQGGMNFAYVSDGAYVVIKDSTVTVEHGNFIMPGSFKHHAFVDADGANGKVTNVKGDVPDFTAKIDIDDSKISALNSGYSKRLGTWVNSTPGGTLFGIGYDPVEIRVDNTDLVGTNRTIGTGENARGVYRLSPTYYYFTNVNFTSAPLSTYTSSWLIQEHVNVQWDGGVIDLKNATAKAVITLDESVDSDPFSDAAFEKAKAKDSSLTREKFDSLYFVAASKMSNIPNYSYCEFTQSGYNVLAQNGTFYSDEITYGAAKGSNEGWSGILFKNCYLTTAPGNQYWKDGSGQQSSAYTLGGTKYTNVGVIEGGVMKSYPIAYLDKAPEVTTTISNKTSTFDDGDGYTLIKGTASGSGTKKFGGGGTIFDLNISSGKYEETKDGYVRLSVDQDNKVTGSNRYIGINYFEYAGDPTHCNKDGVFIVSEFDIATDTGAYLDGMAQIVARYTNSDNKRDFNQNFGNVLKFEKNKLLVSWGWKTNCKGDFDLPTDGSWTRISIVYEIKATESGDAYDFAESQAHLYINGVYYGTQKKIFSQKVDKDKLTGFSFDSLRFNYLDPSSGEASTCFDNVHLSYYTAAQATNSKFLTALKKDPALDLANYEGEMLTMPVSIPIGGSSCGTVDGKVCATESELLAAIKNGSYVELNGDVTTALKSDAMRFTVKLNGHSFAGIYSTTNKLLDYGDIITVARADDDEIFDALVKDESFGVDETVKAALGTIPYYTGLVPGSRVASEGYFKTFVTWVNANGGNTVDKALASDGKIAFTAESELERYYYTITTNGKIEYYQDHKVVENISNLPKGSTAVVVLWDNVIYEGNAEINVYSGSKLYLDVNGCELFMARSKTKNSAVNVKVGAEFYLLSSREGGSLVNAVGFYNNNQARTLGGVVVNVNSDGKNTPVKVTLGTVKNDELGLDAKGDNLTVIGATIVDVYGVMKDKITSDYVDRDGDGVVDYAGYVDVKVDGGNYVRLTSDAMGLFAARAQMKLDIKNATLFGEGRFFNCDARFHEPVMKISIDGSTVVLTGAAMENISTSGRVFGTLYGASHVDITNSTFCGGWELDGDGTVTIGSGVAMTNVPTNGNKKVSFAEGVVAANAKYDAEALTKAPEYSFAYTTADGESVLTLAECSGLKTLTSNVTAAKLTDGEYKLNVKELTLPVLAYAATRDKLAVITWYDTDRESVLGTTLNAPIGEIVIDAVLQGKVAPIYGNEWYDLTFTRWELPELAVGELVAYPVCETPTASVKCLKTNLTVYTYFRLNFYLPAETEERVVLQGIFEDAEGKKPLTGELVTVDGVQYLRYSVYPGAANPKEETRYIVYTVDGNRFVQAFDYGIPTYAEAVMKSADGQFDKEHVTLVSNMVRYANACYKMVAGTTSTRYDELLANYGDDLIDYEDITFSAEELAVDYSKIGKYIKSASFLFGSYQPRFAFEYNDEALKTAKLPKNADGDIGSWPRGNRGVFSHIYYNDYENFSSDHLADHVVYDENGNDVTESFVGAKDFTGASSVYAMSNNVFVYDMTEVMNVVIYAPDGTVVRGTYSLAVYINALDKDSDAYNAAMALYAYSLAAQEYVPVGLIDG